jgi:hypothetical protein
MEMGFFEPPTVNRFADVATGEDEDDDFIRGILQKVGKPLDLPRFRRRVDEALKKRSPISLQDLLALHPLEDAAADLVCYLVVAAEDERHLINPEFVHEIDLNRPFHPRFAMLEQIIFNRS